LQAVTDSYRFDLNPSLKPIEKPSPQKTKAIIAINKGKVICCVPEINHIAMIIKDKTVDKKSGTVQGLYVNFFIQ
jgi:hypothetical protein